MENRVFSALLRWPLAAHLGATTLAFGGLQWVKARLDASYAASGHPADYATGQLAFDARIIESYYARMIEAGTLPVYLQTQFIDFGFIAAMVALSVLLGTLAARLGGRINRLGAWGWWMGLAATMLGAAGAGFDVLENLLSFVMLDRPQAIPQPLALAYSAAAAAKFALLTSAMVCVLLSLTAGVLGRIWISATKTNA